MNPKVIVILGPTASGKTKLAVALARQFNGEIISADSRQIFRGMNIGTGKDLKEYQIRLPLTKGEKKRGSTIPYHLINIKNPNQKFNVAHYQKIALKTIKDISARGRLPILVGGTVLYLSSLLDNYQLPKVKPDQKIRKKLAAMSLAAKQKLLKKLDPEAFQTIALKNPRRLDRALEVCLSGQKFSLAKSLGQPLVDPLIIGLGLPRDLLNQKINARVDAMIAEGLVAEVKKLIKKYGAKSAPLHTIGYAEIIDFLHKKTSLAEATELIKIHTRQYAKRQMTWFKRDTRIQWISQQNEAKKLIKQFIGNP